MNLDSFQDLAVLAPEKRVLVTAGPGAGKTRTLVARLAHMVGPMGISPSRVVAITFTRHAAAEIEERMAGLRIGFVGTLHAFCLRLLLADGERLGYDRRWLTIVSDEDLELEAKEVMEELGLIRRAPRGGYTWQKVTYGQWTAFYATVTSHGDTTELREATAKATPIGQLSLFAAWDGLLARLRAQNLLAYGTILTESLRLLEDRKTLKHFQEQYRHFVVDEAQDTSHVQWGLIWKLIEKAKPATMFVVCDLDQAIYQWRGGDPSEIVKMAQDPAWQVYNLGKSYRFGTAIGTAAGRLIAHNVNRIPKELECVGPEGKVERASNCSVDALTKTIRGAVEYYGAANVAVLSRRHVPLISLESYWQQQGIEIPHVRLGKLANFMGTPAFVTVMAYLKLAANPVDRRAAMQGTASEHVSAAEILDWRRAVLAGSHTWRSAVFGSRLFPDTIPAVGAYLIDKDPHTDYSAAVAWLTKQTYWRGLESAVDIVRWIGMADAQDELPKGAVDGNAVTLCTVHAAKGLEWQCVFLIDMRADTWPSPRSVKAGNIEEERRLAYVGITRAKSRLFVCHTVEDAEDQEAESQFIGEAGL